MNSPAPVPARARAASARAASARAATSGTTTALAVAAAVAFGALSYFGTPATGTAQSLRSIPAAAVPGKLEPKAFPEALLDGRPTRLSAGARIHDLNNRIVMPASLAGTRMDVLYTIDMNGHIDRVWLPSEAERAAAKARQR